MTAVLLDSKVQGATGWVSVRTGGFVVASGLEAGDKLQVSFMPEQEALLVEESGTFLLPEGVKFIRIEHLEAAERMKSVRGVCMDIVKKRA